MFRFANPEYLYLLGVIVVIAFFHYLSLYLRKRRIARYGEPELVKKLFVDVSRFRPELKLWLSLAAFAMLVLALARPQNGIKEVERERYGIEAYVALDISNSMLAKDVSPSRLEKSKMLISNMMTEMADNQMGLVIFAGDAYTQLPITSDFVSGKMFLDQIDPSMISLQGTDIARAIDLCLKSFTSREGINRAIFVITDGEDNEGGSIEAAQRAAAQGVRVFVLGVGSPNGTHIPVRGSSQFMLDETGNPVVSRLNEQMCKDIADAGKGAYIYVDNSSSAQSALNNYIDELEKTKLETESYNEYNEKYHVFLIIGIVLLLFDILVLSRQNHLFKHITLFKNKTACVMFFFGVMFASCAKDSDRDFIRRGNREYRAAQTDSAKYDDAVTQYEKAIALDSARLNDPEKSSSCSRAFYNMGNALLYQNKDTVAIKSYNNAVVLEQNPARKGKMFHNYAVALQKYVLSAALLNKNNQSLLGIDMRNLTEESMNKNKLDSLTLAIESYKNALRLNPSDDESRYNLAVCQWILKKFQNDQQGGGGGDNNQQNDDKDNQQQQQQKDQNENGDEQKSQDQNQKQGDDQESDQKKEQQDEKQGQRGDKQEEKDKDEKISQAAAEQMLNAAQQNERKTQDRINRYNQKMEEKQKERAGQRRLQKNW